VPTIRPVDPATLPPPKPAAVDPLAEPAAQPPATPATRVGVPEVPVVKAAYAENQNGATVVIVPLPGGGVAKLREPPVSLQLSVAQCLANVGLSQDPFFRTLTEAVMHVTEIRGELVQRPVNHIELQKLLNRLGDNGAKLVEYAHRKFFGVLVEVDQLPLSEQQ
jgi:hypothetical protein